MEVTLDARGNAVVWFAEAAADRIGVLRVAPDGTELGADAHDLRLPGAARARARPRRRRLVHGGDQQPHRAAHPGQRRARLGERRAPAPLPDPERGRHGRAGALPRADPHVDPAQRHARRARRRLVHRERATGKVGVLDPRHRGRRRRSTCRATDFGGPPRPPTWSWTAPARCSGRTSTATSSARSAPTGGRRPLLPPGRAAQPHRLAGDHRPTATCCGSRAPRNLLTRVTGRHRRHTRSRPRRPVIEARPAAGRIVRQRPARATESGHRPPSGTRRAPVATA